jgi:hypothetical protein
MKLTLGVALSMATLNSTLAQSHWETVDSVVYPEPGPSAQFTDLAAANDGNIYAVGYDEDTAGNIESSWLRRSEDGGSTWQNTASFAGYLPSVTVDAHGHIYLAGTIPVDGEWTVLRSEDQGASWTTLNSDLLPAFWPADIAVDETGTIWLAGYYRPDPNYGNAIWVVLRGTPAPTGVAWKDVDPYSFDTASLAKPDRIHDGRPMAITIRPMTVGLPEIFVGGRAAIQRSGFLWVVRRSRDGGTTWSTIDQFPSADIGPMDLAISPTDGSIYVVGRIYETLTRKTGQYVSLVRRGVTTSTGGIAWTNVDRAIANPNSVSLRAVTVDGYGRVFAAGHDYNNYGWLVRASIDGVAPYVTTDVFAPGSPSAVVADPANNVFVAGRGGSGAIIRRLAAPTQP